jgi:hypothetical protein
MTVATYSVSADVDGRVVDWSFDEDTQEAMAFWAVMKTNRYTPDTHDPVSGATLFRNGTAIDKLALAPYAGLVVA